MNSFNSINKRTQFQNQKKNYYALQNQEHNQQDIYSQIQLKGLSQNIDFQQWKNRICIILILIAIFILFFLCSYQFKKSSIKSEQLTQQANLLQQQRMIEKALMKQNNFKKQYAQIQICIVSVKSRKLENFKQSVNIIISQTHKNWKAYFYVNSTQDQQARQVYIQDQFKEKIYILQSSLNEGKDYYDSFINKCSYDSVVFMLNEGEYLYKNDSLELYASYLRDQDVYMIAAPTFYNQGLIKPERNIQQFRRDIYFNENKINNKKVIQLSENMMKMVRIIRSQIYRRIQYIDLMYLNQTFYKEKCSFLFPLIQFKCRWGCKFSKNQSQFIVPKKFQVLQNISPLYQTKFEQKIQNLQQIISIGMKIAYLNIDVLINYSGRKHAHGLPPHHNPLLWGNRFNILQRNISNEQKIPKIIHQIWVGKQIPKYKLKFMNRVKEILHDYEYRLWSNQDLSAQNFPFTYKYIKILLENEKDSEYTLLSMVADLMKVEIIYHYGGFYIDTNYQLFKPLDQFLKFPFIGAIQRAPYLGQYLATSFFGAQKQSIFLKRLFSQKILETLDLTNGSKANQQTGPPFLGRGFYQEDYFYSLKVLPPQKIYPYIFWSSDIRWKKSKCIFEAKEEIPQQLSGFYKEIIETEQYKILHPCTLLYQNAYGIDHWDLGSSWKKPKF